MYSLRPLLTRHFRGLRFKTTLLLAGVVLLSTGLSAFFCAHAASKLTREQARSRIRDVAHALAVSAVRPMSLHDHEALLGRAEGLIPDDGILYVAFADPAGRVLAGAQQAGGHLSKLLFDHATMIPVAPLDQAITIEDQATGPRLDFTYPVFASAQAADHDEKRPVLGFVRIGLSLGEVESDLTRLRESAAWVAVLIAALMIPVGFAVVHGVAAPLNRLRRAAEAIAAGKLHQRVAISRRDEIGDLAASFNAMADDLSRSHDELVRLNSELEDRVQSRTFQLTEVNRRLQDEVAEKDDFLRAVSHDLSAPLRNVSGMISVMQSRKSQSLPREAGDLLKRIDASVRNELELIDELLELCRIRTRRESSQRVDLDKEVRAIAAQFEFDLQGKGLTVQIERPLPVVFAEKIRMRQLWQNLIDNAIKYTDPARIVPGADTPCIRISWVDRPNFHEFRVADCGIGIAPRDRDRVFYVFRRARDGFVAKTSGKGVGLANCKSIVQNYQGRIWIESNQPHGSVFCFTLCKDRLVPAPRGGEASETDPLTTEPIGAE